MLIHAFFNSGIKAADLSGTSATTEAPNITNVKTLGDPYIGDPKAKVVIAYWSDYQSPQSKQFELTTFQDIIKGYVETGKVKVVFKDFSFLGADSDTAGIYVRAVWLTYPDQFYAWRVAMFNAQGNEKQGFGDEASIIKLTSVIPGIDIKLVQSFVSVNGAELQSEMNADKTEGVGFGIQGTPSFITGTTLIPGEATYTDFAKVIDSELGK